MRAGLRTFTSALDARRSTRRTKDCGARFLCDSVLCGRRIFCEQFDKDVLACYGRRTQRLETIVHHLGLPPGGRPASALAYRLIMRVSNVTLVRVVPCRTVDQPAVINVVDIHDFAFRRRQTYGTIVCDFERRRPLLSCQMARW